MVIRVADLVACFGVELGNWAFNSKLLNQTSAAPCWARWAGDGHGGGGWGMDPRSQGQQFCGNPGLSWGDWPGKQLTAGLRGQSESRPRLGLCKPTFRPRFY